MKPNHHLVKVKDIWYFRAEIDKKVVKFTLNTTNLKRARADRDKYLIELQHTGTLEKLKVKQKVYTMVDLIDGFIQDLEERLAADEIKKATYVSYASMIKYYIRPALKDFNLTDVTGRVIDKMIRNISTAKGTKKQVRAVLSGMFTYAVSENLLEDNPVRQSKSIKVDDRRKPNALTFEEARHLLDTYKGWYHEYFEFLIFTGVRPCEAAGLEWSSVDLVNGSATIKQNYVLGELGRNKTISSNRTIILTDNVVECLRRQRIKTMGKTNFVFSTDKLQMINNDNIRKRHWKNALKAAGLDYREFYITRHSFITNCCKNGVPLDIISKQAGNSISMITKHYMSDITNGAEADLLNQAVNHTKTVQSENQVSNVS